MASTLDCQAIHNKIMMMSSHLLLIWRSLVKDRPAEYGKVLCAIKASASDDYWTAICTYDPAQHRLFVPNDSQAKFGDWIMKKDVHWTEAPVFETRDMVPAEGDRLSLEEISLRTADKALCAAHEILLDLHSERTAHNDTVEGDPLSVSLRHISTAIETLRQNGESPDYLARWEREQGNTQT